MRTKPQFKAMKTHIEITGQISGNFRLLNALNAWECESKKLPFDGFLLTFETRKAARRALWQGFRYLRAAEPEFKHGIGYCPKHSLSYDASKAVIIEQ